jgi:hypothetical protein
LPLEGSTPRASLRRCHPLSIQEARVPYLSKFIHSLPTSGGMLPVQPVPPSVPDPAPPDTVPAPPDVVPPDHPQAPDVHRPPAIDPEPPPPPMVDPPPDELPFVSAPALR